jgi:hypothetical protein
MAETFAWPEGSCHFWTGTATASAVLAYAQQTNVMLVRGWYNTQTLDGTYHDKLTGQRANVTIGALWTPDQSALVRLYESATAVHVHFRHALSGGGSAGHVLYSGRIDNLQLAGQDGGLYQMMMMYHANSWSAYP